MGKERLAAFSDGVIAILITIMVLEFRVPHGVTLGALLPLLPVFLSYVLSFTYIAIYWNNHHHLLYVTKQVSGTILWANMHLLFWLSLVPFATNWVGEHPRAPVPAAVYGVLLLMAAIAYWLLQRAILRAEGSDSVLAAALGNDFKGKLSPVLCLAAVFFALLLPGPPWIADGLYVLVALLWLIPDRRIERAVSAAESPAQPKKAATDAAGKSRQI